MFDLASDILVFNLVEGFIGLNMIVVCFISNSRFFSKSELIIFEVHV